MEFWEAMLWIALLVLVTLKTVDVIFDEAESEHGR